MSTKIYNGLILRNHSLEKALIKLQSIYPMCEDMAKESLAKTIALIRCENADLPLNATTFEGTGVQPEKHDSSMFLVMDKVREAKKRVLGNQTRDTTWDYTFDVSLFPYGRHLIAMYFIENDPGYKEALASIGFEDFHYQTSVDKPEEISAREWNRRKKAWSKIVLNKALYSQQGFSYSVVTWQTAEFMVWEKALVAQNIPSDEVRRKQVAITLAALEVYVTHANEKPHQQFSRVKELVPAYAAQVILNPDPFESPIGP